MKKPSPSKTKGNTFEPEPISRIRCEACERYVARQRQTIQDGHVRETGRWPNAREVEALDLKVKFPDSMYAVRVKGWTPPPNLNQRLYQYVCSDGHLTYQELAMPGVDDGDP